MDRSPVKSQIILSVGYDEPSRTLEIEFWDHAVWQYYPVTVEGYNQFIGARSIGKYFHSHIKGNSALTATQSEPGQT